MLAAAGAAVLQLCLAAARGSARTRRCARLLLGRWRAAERKGKRLDPAPPCTAGPPAPPPGSTTVHVAAPGSSWSTDNATASSYFYATGTSLVRCCFKAFHKPQLFEGGQRAGVSAPALLPLLDSWVVTPRLGSRAPPSSPASRPCSFQPSLVPRGRRSGERAAHVTPETSIPIHTRAMLV